MKIQIWGKSKCFDTKKAERYFKERRIPYQAIDLLRYGMSRGELTSVKNAVGLDAMLNPKAADYALVQHLAYEQDKIERLLEDPSLLQTPIVRNGRQATVGYCPDVWKTVRIKHEEIGNAAVGLLLFNFNDLPARCGDRIAHPLQTGLNDRARHGKIQAHIPFGVADEEGIPALEQHARLVGEEIRKINASGRQWDRSTHARGYVKPLECT